MLVVVQISSNAAIVQKSTNAASDMSERVWWSGTTAESHRMEMEHIQIVQMDYNVIIAFQECKYDTLKQCK